MHASASARASCPDDATKARADAIVDKLVLAPRRSSPQGARLKAITFSPAMTYANGAKAIIDGGILRSVICAGRLGRVVWVRNPVDNTASEITIWFKPEAYTPEAMLARALMACCAAIHACFNGTDWECDVDEITAFTRLSDADFAVAELASR